MGRTCKASPPRKKRSPNYETNVSAADTSLQQLPLPEKLNYTATAAKFDIKCATLRNRYLNLHRPVALYHEQRKLLTSTREEVLLEWMFHHAEEGRPWGREFIKIKVCRLIGKKPSNEWVKGFKKCHHAVLKFCGASGLDPKRAQAFNPHCIADQFQKLSAGMRTYQYKVHNIYNFDETGMQVGGGRKRTGRKWFMSRRSRAKYKQRDGNLELVTVVECACADGAMLDPGFLFQGSHTYDIDWFQSS
ncbi:hypothetical protein D9615_003065 [Tricholomella constricta]|uniref:HTH CENPB-type domain-containing protein n=1 Tax=Tricholomella constricta TaxID=117010 RepID=A0A8H5M6I6_9AGAR|nr:hypothetical protein D9615_003065 [Tricholomella constricta]